MSQTTDKPQKISFFLRAINFLLLAIQFHIGLVLFGMNISRDSFMGVSSSIFGNDAPLMNNAVIDFFMGKWMATIVAIVTLFCVFYKDRFFINIKKRLLINAICTVAFFAVALAFVLGLWWGL